MTITFQNNEQKPFLGLTRAQYFLSSKGYAFGSLSGEEPVGIKKGNYKIAKWKNLSSEDKKILDGIITSNDFRNQAVTITIK